ncbi:MAG: prepilin peptidase [Myxococcales bacterium]|nr:prepilin peptidase [Myxococcales bacterium]
MNFAVNIFEQLPPLYLYGIAFLYGAFVGSFLNVCIIRIPLEGMSVFSPARSICFGCNKQIAWYDNIPILSYLFLRGRCRCEKYSISLQYPLVELMTAVMAVAVVRRFGATWESIVIFLFICALIVITFIDLAYWIIPDVISLPSIPLAIGAAALFGPPHLPTWQDAAFGAALGGGSLLAIHLFYEWVLKRTGLGLGDVKLLAMIGAFVGWRSTLTVVFLASIQGVIVTIFLYLLGWREQVPDDWDEEETNQENKEAEANADSASSEASTASSGDESKETAQPEETPVETSTTQEGPETSTTQETTETTTSSEASSKEETEISEPSEDAKDSGASESSEDKATEEPQAPSEGEDEVAFGRVAIPFGPFLALGALEVIFWGERIVSWWMETAKNLFQP